MIFTLSIECVRGAYLQERFSCLAEVSSDMTLDELHIFIQELAEFDDDHLSTFYIANSTRGKKIWFTDTGEFDEEQDESMWDISLKQIFPMGPRNKLYYWFDFGDDWIFEIREKGKETTPLPGMAYPRLIHREGPTPTQYPNFEE
ncbi:MAG: hypothetical protein Q8L45_07905 [Xanthomonadaceae bacterium]|nr:hypothetical protein [Xanthomonadaceae bacterium]MDP2184977.1 hypothetical protein [Xanthomonadales bacterium]MDZ4114443.1 hypothetical protein [Xanthomonadaceae bacterium]